MAPDQIWPMGFAIPCPAMSGAEPWTGSNIEGYSPFGFRLVEGAIPMLPATAAPRSLRMSQPEVENIDLSFYLLHLIPQITHVVMDFLKLEQHLTRHMLDFIHDVIHFLDALLLLGLNLAQLLFDVFGFVGRHKYLSFSCSPLGSASRILICLGAYHLQK